MNNIKQIIIMGLGYIGLPTAAFIASKKIYVHGVDINPKVVDTINQGKIHIIEPDLEGLVKYVVEKGYLIADTKPKEADVYVIAVPTPFKENHEPDISYVESAIRMIIPYLRENNLVIIESTSPVGTTEKMAELIFNERPELKGKLYIAYCPERVLPGKILYELEHNDRVIGGLDEKSTEKAIEFYSLFVKGNLHKTNSKTAEMCKLVENAYRDLNIAFANELSIICDKLGIDVWELIELANKHPRVNILKPGVGVGGHCIAVDPWFIVSQFPNEAKLIKTAREVNDFKPLWVVQKIEEQIKEFRKRNNKEPIIGCLGLTYKPDIDDLRESPALEVVEILINKGYKVMANEPNIQSEIIGSNIKNYSIDEVLSSSDLIFLLVPHKVYRNFMNNPKLIIKLYYFSM
jgi:UDP-N-acetyl-D-mannosaminuronic acid dehydrogenase